ncbi:hypothetical protein BGZ57DRAFT_898923 [Hyaloscypha finlandica]|nr:hypothetical protein BGZ57DRAFT_898923 [Hyaloscypha finlandica]
MYLYVFQFLFRIVLSKPLHQYKTSSPLTSPLFPSLGDSPTRTRLKFSNLAPPAKSNNHHLSNQRGFPRPRHLLGSRQDLACISPRTPK